MKYKRPTEFFDGELAGVLGEKIELVYRDFDRTSFGGREANLRLEKLGE
jgi:hypothetical protein